MEQDLSKRPWYLTIDLLTKVLSSIALIALGYVGWRLQYETQARREWVETQEVQSRKYLPPLQVLTQLQIASAQTLDKLENLDSNTRRLYEFTRAGRQLGYFVNSLRIPREITSEVALTPWKDYEQLDRPKGIQSVGILQLTAMTSELLLAIPDIEDICSKKNRKWRPSIVILQKEPPLLYFAQDAELPLPGDRFVPLSPGNIGIWERWFPLEGMQISAACKLDVKPILEEIVAGSGQIVSEILGKHPDLADKVVQIRVDALRIQSGFFSDVSR